MGDFTASNGVPVIPDRLGGYQLAPESAQMGAITGVNANQAQALREFFQKENDDRLGRWRWPENPDYVVYPQEDGGVWVLSESTGLTMRQRRENFRSPMREVTLFGAAWAYFDANGPKLPTEPGLYRSGALDGTPRIWHLKPDGSWVLINTNSIFPPEDGHIQRHLPFTRLLPEGES